MKALSIKNPWAYLIFHNGKNVENRTYQTKFRGELLIHASKKSMGIGDCLAIMPRRFSYADIISLRERADRLNGFIIGRVQLVDCVQSSSTRVLALDFRKSNFTSETSPNRWVPRFLGSGRYTVRES